MASIFSNNFFSVKGQKERFTNAINTTKTAIGNIANTFSFGILGKQTKISATENFSGTLLGKAAETIANNPLSSAAVLGTGANIVRLGASGTATAAKQVGTALLPTAKAAAANKTIQKVVGTTAALALVAPALVNQKSIKTTAALALNPTAAIGGTIYNLASGELDRQTAVFKGADTSEKVKLAALDIGVGSAAVGTALVGYELWQSFKKNQLSGVSLTQDQQKDIITQQGIEQKKTYDVMYPQFVNPISSPVPAVSPLLPVPPTKKTSKKKKKPIKKKKKQITKRKKTYKKKFKRKKTYKKKKSLNKTKKNRNRRR